MDFSNFTPLEYDGKRVAITSMMIEYVLDKEPEKNTANNVAVFITMKSRRELEEGTDFYSLTSGNGLQEFKEKYPHLPKAAARFLLYAKSGVTKLANVPRLACLKDFAKDYFKKVETPNLSYFPADREPTDAELKAVEAEEIKAEVKPVQVEVVEEKVDEPVDEPVIDKSLTIFKNEQFGEIRTAGTADNPLFCLADLCKALELDASQVIKRLDDGVVSIHPITDKLGRTQNANFVNEDGLYDVILDSRKPEAKKFRKWITSEVLPTIRKTGEYKPKKKSVTVKPSAMVKEVDALAKVYEKSLGVKRPVALAKAVSVVGKFFNYDVNSMVADFLPPVDYRSGYMNATQLGAKVGLNARQVNQKLAELGLQDKDDKGNWRLTDKGDEHADVYIFEANGHTDTQIRWRDSAVALLEA